jgi:SAM-dependent methyltransferase
MLTKPQLSTFRETLFRHLDGIATAPVAYSLHQKGVLDYILQEKNVELTPLSAHFQTNEGYLHVALRVLASQGWLHQEIDNAQNRVFFSTLPCSEEAFSLVPTYREVVELLRFTGKFHPRKFEKEPFLKLRQVFQSYLQRFGLPQANTEQTTTLQHQILTHIEGILIGPTIVRLAMGGMFHKYFMQASFRAEEYHEDAESFGELLDFFTHLGWFEKKNDTYRFTEKGLFFAKRAPAYGVTVSYIPTFRVVDELIFGNPLVLQAPEGQDERHVDRFMNVWGSGGAHASYFQKVDEIIIDLFNRPIDEQPRGVLDMGCGNGAFLEHIFEVIAQRTTRGKMLDEYPLILVGADYNQAALQVTRANLIKADIWAKVVWGDIGRPDLLAQSLEEDYGIALQDLLNVRTFLDHNRIWDFPAIPDAGTTSTSTGAFAFRGQRLNNNLVEANLLEHFQKWAPYIRQFGLLVIELHTINSALSAAHPGKTAATAYDATHGFSDQFIVEKEVFYRVAEKAGLHLDDRLHARFPDSELATVTVNLLKGQTSL